MELSKLAPIAAGAPTVLPGSDPYFVPGTLSAEAAAAVRNDMALRFCKWDPQVGDVATLAPFPLVLDSDHRDFLFRVAADLTRELLAAEDEITANPELMTAIGLPWKIRRLLSTPPDEYRLIQAPRVLRFDFHWTAEGWKLSEVNSDVPGGFSEATAFTELMERQFPEYEPTGLPARTLVRRISSLPGDGRTIAFVTAPGLMEDHQVVAYLADCLESFGWEAHLASPGQISWHGGHARLSMGAQDLPLDVLYRFLQGEWLPLLPRSVEWQPYFRGSVTPIINSGIAMISESKRLPIVWDRLTCPMTTWRAFLPETRAIHDAPWRNDDAWILKSAYSNGGETVSMRDLLSPNDWRRVVWRALRQPDAWLAQKRFVAIPVATPDRAYFPCIGVYTIDGEASGIYARLSPKPWIDYSAVDVAVLVKRGSE